MVANDCSIQRTMQGRVVRRTQLQLCRAPCECVNPASAMKPHVALRIRGLRRGGSGGARFYCIDSRNGARLLLSCPALRTCMRSPLFRFGMKPCSIGDVKPERLADVAPGSLWLGVSRSGCIQRQLVVSSRCVRVLTAVAARLIAGTYRSIKGPQRGAL